MYVGYHIELQQTKSRAPSPSAEIETVAREVATNANAGVQLTSEAQAQPRIDPQQHGRRTGMTRLRTLFAPSHPVGPSPGYLPSLKSAITYTPLNVCLAFIPVSWALHYSHQSDTLTFICSALAIIPLAAQLTLATEQIALRTSQAVGGLVNATFGNIVEMIIGGIALNQVSIQHACATNRAFSTCYCAVRSRARTEFSPRRAHK